MAAAVEPKELRLREMIAKELSETEDMLLQRLRGIVERLVRPAPAEIAAKLNPRGALDAVISAHSHLRDALVATAAENKQRGENPLLGAAAHYCTLAKELWDCYGPAVATLRECYRHDTAAPGLLQRLSAESRAFREVLAAAEEAWRPEGVATWCCVYSGRLARYELLLREVKKHTPESEHDAADAASEAFAKVNSTVYVWVAAHQWAACPRWLASAVPEDRMTVYLVDANELFGARSVAWLFSNHLVFTTPKSTRPGDWENARYDEREQRVTSFIELTSSVQTTLQRDAPGGGVGLRIEVRNGGCTLSFRGDHAEENAKRWQDCVEAIGMASKQARTAAWTFLWAMDPRLGAASPAAITTRDTLQYIAQLCCSPTAEVHFKPNTRCWCC